jgi:hypothetical protein
LIPKGLDLVPAEVEDRRVSLLRIAVVDGQGASIGSAVIRRIRLAFGEEVEIWALGTNAIATSQMLRAGANRGAAGEGALCHSLNQVDVVVGTLSILISDSFMGELTPTMAQAVSKCRAIKLLLPLTQEPIHVVGTAPEPLPHHIEVLIDRFLTPLVQARGGKPESHSR